MQRLSQSLTDDDFVQDPYPFYDKAHAAGPTVFWEGLEMLAVFSHAGVASLLRDKRLGRTPLKPRPRPSHLEPFRALDDHSMLELEPPRHTRLRRLVLRAFTSRRINALAPQIEQVARDLIAALPVGVPFDLIPRFCQPLPVRIIARLLGVPESLAPELLRWSTDMVALYQSGVTQQTEERAGQAAAEFTEFMRDHIDARRSSPADDLITDLIAAKENGATLSTDEMVSTCILLLNAGHEATVHSLGNSVRVLAEHGHIPGPDTWAELVEELLRFEAPLHVFTRFAYEDVELPGGVTLQRGQEVALVLGAANRDPSVFEAPHAFNPARNKPAHTSFGGGIHFCVGAPLARMELQIALRTLFEAYPDLRLAEPPRFADSYHFHKHDRLIVTLGPI